MNRRLIRVWRFQVLGGLVHLLVNARNFYHHHQRELRRYPRALISIRVTRVHSGSFAYYQTYNISAGGLFLKSLEPAPRGAELDLQFELYPGGEQIRAKGEVAWTRGDSPDGSEPSGMGIKFTEISEASRRTIKNFVEMRL
jgi:molecular chaperone DnaK